jgi:hypothetical protein
VRTIDQELFLACIPTYTEVTLKPVKPANLAKRKFPIKMLNVVLNKDTGDLMKMRQLLKNPKYTNLWGKLYTKELGQLAQGIPGTKDMDTIVFIKYKKKSAQPKKELYIRQDSGCVSTREGPPKYNKAHGWWKLYSVTV